VQTAHAGIVVHVAGAAPDGTIRDASGRITEV